MLLVCMHRSQIHQEKPLSAKMIRWLHIAVALVSTPRDIYRIGQLTAQKGPEKREAKEKWKEMYRRV